MDFNKIENDLLGFEKPARYIGNEIGIPKKDFINSNTRFVLSYPDIYEIGMSNQGIKIIYDRINKLDFASCERVFSPWVDFEKYLNINNFPLFSLETKTALNKFDIIGFSIQYELLFSNFLNILSLGKINIFSKDRKDNEPIVLCGGPSIVNPVPFSPFVDLFLIGEGEVVIELLIAKYNNLKAENKSREYILEELSNIEGIFSPVFSKNKVTRQIFADFYNKDNTDTFIIPNIDIIQNKFVVEIMRGCPNKCRFCQAGVIYKPYREKDADLIIDTIEKGLKNTGANEITLSSLSSGDYSEILNLTEYFNNKYSKYNISFSLPSIKVESFDIDLLEKISFIRKSGLTFAIESGNPDGQLSINKIVLLEKIYKILEYAVKNGWKVIKFYFMIGLPDQDNEYNNIIEFIDKILFKYRKININLNIAVFVPKPHTPYQYEKQLSLEESIDIIGKIESYYKHSKVKVKKHNPYMSYLEGFISRGDEKIGLAMYEAFINGARFDGWDERFNYDIYKNVLDKNNITYDEYLNKKNYENKLFWDCIDTGLSKEYLSDELNKSKNKILTKSCKEECESKCNICNKKILKHNSKKIDYKIEDKILVKEHKSARFLIEFSKLNLLKYIGHIDLLRYFEKLFLRSEVKIAYSQGFNPHPKIQFSSALSLGIESKCELMEFHTYYDYNENDLLNKLRLLEHENIPINRIKKMKYENKISIFDLLNFTLYSINYDNSYYAEILKIFNDFNNKNNNYAYIKKDKNYSGIYQDYIYLDSINKNNILLRIKKVNNMPKIIQFKDEFFKYIPVKIIKEKVFTINKNDNVEIFDYIN